MGAVRYTGTYRDHGSGKVYRTTCGPWERITGMGADKVWNVYAKKRSDNCCRSKEIW